MALMPIGKYIWLVLDQKAPQKTAQGDSARDPLLHTESHDW